MRWLLILVALATAVPAVADRWVPPRRTTYFSADKAVRLIVEPRELQSPLQDKAKGHEPAGQRAGETKRTARGVLERRVAGRWTRVWEAPLANGVAPVTALVSNGGEHVVTFDNWYSRGWGDNVVVIYDGAGKLVRALRLDQIVPAEYIQALPSSVSSLRWSGEHRFAPDGRHLALAIVIPNDDRLPSDRHATVEVAVDLNTGAVVPPSGAAWDRALAQAKRVASQSGRAQAAAEALAAKLNAQ